MEGNEHPVEGAIRERFAALAGDPRSETRFAVGARSAAALGYEPSEIAALPPEVVARFAGVGRPFDLGAVRPGETVVDIGCGAGFDALLAARATGGDGRVIGVDFVSEMLAVATRGAAALRLGHVDFRLGRADRLPVDDAAADLVITNGVFNLCTDKAAVVAEMARVLRAGGRLQMADILVEGSLSAADLARKGEWSD